MTYDQLSREQLEEALQALEGELHDTQQRLDGLEQEHEQLRRRAMKIKADFENYRDDEDTRKQRWQDRARKELAEDLISVMDNLERAITSADEDTAILQGVKMVADQLYEALERRGLSRIDAAGEEFDPRLHSAVDVQEHHTHNEVIEQRRHGYMYDDQVLREAEVVVGQHPDHTDQSGSDETTQQGTANTGA